jgi:hypothetical protein
VLSQDRYAAVVISTRKGFTARWPCCQGDYLFWFRRDPLAGFAGGPESLDVWQIPHGAYVTITNCWQDFPSWFDLHPTEVADGLIGWMKKRIEAHDYPEEPIEGPNIWRVKGGDRVVWVGPAKPDQTSIDGVLGILDCRNAVAVLGDHPNGPFSFMEFEPASPDIKLGAAALQAERALGLPRLFETEWRLG